MITRDQPAAVMAREACFAAHTERQLETQDGLMPAGATEIGTANAWAGIDRTKP